MDEKSKVTHYTTKESGWWKVWDDKNPPMLVHSIHFSDNTEWDAYGGWRTSITLGVVGEDYDPTDPTMQRPKDE